MWLFKTDCLLLKMMLVKQSYHFLSQYLCLLLALLSPSYLVVQGGDRKREKSVFWAFFIYETLEERLSSINSSYNVFTAEKKSWQKLYYTSSVSQLPGLYCYLPWANYILHDQHTQ